MAPRCLVFVASILFATLPGLSQSIDYHQHLPSPSAAKLGSLSKPSTARDLIRLLDSAGVRRALVLSLAYQYGNPNKPPIADEYAQVRRENDWTAGQVAEYPDRLRAFCGIDPLKSARRSRIRSIARESHDRACHGLSPSPPLAADLSPVNAAETGRVCRTLTSKTLRQERVAIRTFRSCGTFPDFSA